VHLMLYGRRLATLLAQPWDLVHCWEEPYVASAVQVVRLTSPRVPLVIATFQNIHKRYPFPFDWMERQALDRADGVIAFGHTTFEVVDRHGFAPSRTRVIPPGVDVVRFSPDPEARRAIRAKLGWSDDTPVVGFLGRLVPEKGLGLLTDTLDRLTVPWRALFVGSGPLESELRRWAGRHGGRVVIETGVGHAEVPRWLNAMCCARPATPRPDGASSSDAC
jgi:glycosyltransferase involved in cell wall biosynthesis